ncbi:MAG: histidine--tRNA ligase [Verrucomicrobia bacterium]|nr:histidine--tRNA ligase [Verrucomicrobiota bacterium]MCF7708885.1 histidine--tRNA ligase [Verrucomicrobiota bacterium]
MDRLPGFRDFFPEPLPHSDVWSANLKSYIFDTWRRVSERYGFSEYDGPPLEPLELFTLKSGDEIVGQLYNFVDKGDREVALRPEMTPTLARMVAAFQRNYKKPIKWYAVPQLFRYERQQKGRLREHFQWNADIFGESDPAADAELVALLIDGLRSFGLTEDDFVIRLSSRNAWDEFFTNRVKDAGQDSEYRFFQIIDKLEREPAERSEEELRRLGLSLDEVRGFISAAEPTAELARIKDNIDSRGLGGFVRIDYGVVRGLAYYTGPVFEAFDKKGEFRAIAGGGRYDSLVKLISGGKVDLPALGFGMGDVVLTELLKSRKLIPHLRAGLDVYFLIEDDSLRRESLGVIQDLRNAGSRLEYPLTSLKPDKQFKRAMELEAKCTVKLERNDDGGLWATIKNLETREQRIVALEELGEALNG